MRRTVPAALAVWLVPSAAWAHDAFGDMGPFYASFLHPLADPAQALVLAGAAALLARQPLETVRPAFAALVLAGGAAVALAVGGLAPEVTPLAAALFACLLGGLAVAGLGLPRLAAALVAGAAGGAAGLAADMAGGAGARDLALGLAGGVLGLALTTLFLWGLLDLAVRRLGPVAGAVAGSWVAAVGIMTAALSTL